MDCDGSGVSRQVHGAAARGWGARVILRLEEQVAKARARAADFDLGRLAAGALDAPVRALAPDRAIADKRKFLEDGHGRAEAARLLERVLEGNELQPVNYLERGAAAARAVCRITIRNPGGRHIGYGTGFLVAPGFILTNNHVLQGAGFAAQSFAEFDFALGADDRPLPPVTVELDPQRFFATSEPLDFTLVACRETARDGRPTAGFGHLPLIPQTGKVIEGEWLTIIQHPDGEPKKVCVRENRFLKRTDDVLWYSTDTMGGSSGSPVFNNDWQVVALHHSGVPDTGPDGRWLTWSGEPYDEGRHGEGDIKWIANEGIRVSRIVAALAAEHAGNPALQPFMAAAAEATPAITHRPAAPAAGPAGAAPMPASARTLTVTLTIGPDGAVGLGDGPPGPALAAPGILTRSAREDVSIDPDYSNRRGYRPDFLGGFATVPFPQPDDARLAAAAPLIVPGEAERPPADLADALLAYDGYSLLMHAARRLAIVSAANVDFANRYAALDSRTEDWRIDPRIRAEHQLGNFFYRGTQARKNRFDRGHLTRNEDMEYGATKKAAVQRARDTFHYTNCAPQHEAFNQRTSWQDGGQTIAMWQGLERHILEDSIERKNFRAMLFTGPVLADDDPEWDRFPGIPYPLKFWKVAVAETLEGGGLFATAFLMDQSRVIEVEGLERAGVPFEPFAFQVPVSRIEGLTGLSFTWQPAGGDVQPLSTADVLARNPQEAMRRRRAAPAEAAGGPPLPEDHVPLLGPDDIILP